MLRKKHTFNLSEEVHRLLVLKACVSGKTLNEEVEQALIFYLLNGASIDFQQAKAKIEYELKCEIAQKI